MRKTLRGLVLFLAAGMIFGLAGCGDDDEGEDALSKLFVDSGNSRLRVDNTSSEDLLLFNGAPSASNRPFAGVLSGRQDWGTLNPSTGLWVLYVVSKSEYTRYPDDPRVAMSRLVYVDNVPATYSVGTSTVGSVPIMVVNRSAHYVELRQNFPEGPLFLTVRPYEFGSVKYVAEGAYNFFPIVKTEIRAGQQTIGVFSRFFQAGAFTKGVYPDGNATFDVTPSELGIFQNIECLIIIHNNFGMDSYVHLGNASGPTVRSTLDRELAVVGSAFMLSRRPELNPTTGAPLQTTIPVSLVLNNVQRSSSIFSQECDIGKVYTITCDSFGQWTVNSVANAD